MEIDENLLGGLSGQSQKATTKPIGLDTLQTDLSAGVSANRRQPIASIKDIATQEGADAILPVIEAIYAQESGSGAGARTSIDGAQGGMQVIPATFQRYAKPGERIDNPNDNLKVGVRIIKDLARKFGNDPAKIATGYFSGDSNVNAGSGEPWKNDTADGNGKRVSGYVGDVLKRMGIERGAKPTAGAPDLKDAPAWQDITQTDEFAALSDKERAQAKQIYFDYWIAPHAGNDLARVRKEFLSQYDLAKDTRGLGQKILDTGRNVAAGALKIGPTAVKGVADIARLASGDTVGGPLSDSMQRGMDAIDKTVGSQRLNDQQQAFANIMANDAHTIGDAVAFALDNPAILVDQGITTIGSMFLPAGAAKGAVGAARFAGAGSRAAAKAATATTIGAAAAQNAADTFDALKGQSLDDRYRGAAVSAAVSILTGMATGGGAEGQIARKMADDLKRGKTTLEVAKEFIKSTLKEGGQEAGEEVGNVAGETIGSGQAPSGTAIAKRAALAATLGGALGGGVDLAVHATGGHEQEPTPPGAAATPPAPTGAPQRTAPVMGDAAQPPAPTNPGAPPPAGYPSAGPAPKAEHQITQDAHAIVADLANAAGVPLSTVLPATLTPRPDGTATLDMGVDVSDSDVLDMANARYEQLIAKRDGTRQSVMTDRGPANQDVPGEGLTPQEADELDAIESSGGDMAVLRQLYFPGGSNVQEGQTQVAPDGLAPSPIVQDGQPGGAAAVAQPDAGGQAADEGAAGGERVAGQQDAAVQGQDQLGQADGWIYNQDVAPPPVIDPEAEAERAAIQNEGAPVDEQAPADIPFEPARPRTEKEARALREAKQQTTTTQDQQQNGNEAPQAQPSQAQSAEREQAPTDAVSAETWWEKELTPHGRRKAMESAGVKHTDSIRWGYVPEASKQKLAALRGTVNDPVRSDAVAEAAHEAATSPLNDLPQPTEAQKEAGNYKKGHLKFAGLDLTIENPVGSTRTGTDRNGKPWSVDMTAHYGYLKRSEGADGDQVDVYLADKPNESAPVFVFDQYNDDGSFDEHKAVAGAGTLEEAKAIYDAHFADGSGPRRRKAVQAMPVADFKKWATEGDTSKPLVQRHRTEKESRKAKALDRIAAGTAYFGSDEKAQAFVADNGLQDTHTVKQTKPSRFEVVEKGAPRRGKVGDMMAAGEAVTTASGRETTPFPKIDTSTNQKAGNTVKHVDQWLMSNALAEAEARGDEFNARQFRQNQDRPSQADKDSAEEYLFGDSQPPVLPSILKDLTPKQLAPAPRIDEGSKTEKPAVAGPEASEKSQFSDLEKQLHAQTHDKEAAGDVGVVVGGGKVRFASLADAVEAAKQAIAAGVRPVPFQIHDATGIRLGDVDRVIKALSVILEAGYADLHDALKAMADQQAEPAADDLGAMFDDVLAEEVAARTPPKTERQARERKQKVGRRVVNPDGSYYNEPAQPRAKTEREARTAREAAASAAQNTAAALTNAIDGLGELFGGKGKLSSGLTFDPDTYAKAKPLFQAAVANLQDAGGDLRDAMRAIVRMVLDKFGPDAANNMKPYVVRYVQDMRDGTAEQAQNEAGNTPEQNNGRGETQSERDQGPSGAAAGERTDVQQGSAPADSQGVADQQPANVGAAEAGGDSGGSGAAVADGNVGSESGVRGKRDAADRRSRAGRAGASDDGAREDASGDRPAESVEPAPESQRANYFIADPEALIGGTPKVRFARNKKAIEALNAITSEARAPTQDELDAMAAYIGWGSFGQELFQGSYDRPAPKTQWEKESDWLREHLGRAGWESAQRSIINAHYTDPVTVGAMWDMVRKLGFAGGKVLEPSMGVGNFFGLMPRDLMAKSQLAGIEMDETTGGMAKLLYPDANIQIKPYQDSKTADGFYDLVIGNWPFAKDGPADRRYMKLSPSLHDYFFLKALDQTRPGGLVVGITSAGTMDKMNTMTRAALAEKGDLVAAFRLPSGAFEKYAGTAVVTDILIFKKRAAANPDTRDAGWIKTEKVDTPAGQQITVNKYFAKNRDAVLGTLNFGSGTTYGRAAMIVDRPADIEQRVRALAEKLPEGVYEPRTTKAKTIQYVTNNTKDRQQSIIEKDGQLYQVQGEYLAPLHEVISYRVKDAKKTAAREAQIRELVAIRRAYGALIDAERAGDADTEAKRKTLRDAYDGFIKTHGSLWSSEGLAILERAGDPFYPSIAALEQPDGKPATILSRATVRGNRKVEKPSVRDALVLARNETVDVDMARVAELAGVSLEKAAKELLDAGAVFQAPAGTYEVSDVYLSGNVRRKMREAKAAAEAGMDMERNIKALESVMPKDVPYYNIEAKLGATWIQPDQYRKFIEHLLGKESSQIVVKWTVNRWKVRFEDRALLQRPEARTTWGHSDIQFDRLLTHAFGNVTVKIWGRDADGNKVVDERATAEANEKAMRIREEFANWLWSDAERKVELERTYNEVMNAMALPKYDGSFLSFEGMALQRGESPFNLRKHQVDAIWRGLANGRGINAHEVGTGKTYTMGGLAVESRRYGLAKKPIIFAHNANSATVAREINEMYPGAKILYVDNLAPDRIAVTLRQIANDDWDAVVVPHSLIDRFTLKRETLDALSRDEIQALEQEAMEAAAEDGANLTVEKMNDPEEMKKVRSATAKQLVHARNAIIKRIEEMALRSSREDSISFEDMGIDMVIVDEAHEFKKPPIATRMRMRGLNTQTSNQSISLNLLTGYVKQLNNGRGVHLFTGTPITNTMTEIFNVMRYVMDDQMDRDGIKDWDSWFNTFADATSDVELTAAGEYEPVTRLAAFVNVPELRRIVGQFMDIVFADDMPEFKPRATASGKTMTDADLTDEERNQLMNGRTEKPIGRPYKKVVTDVAEMTGAQTGILDLLRERALRFKNATKRERKEIMMSGRPESPVIVETDASNAGLDARLFDRNAKDEPTSKVNRAVKRVAEHYNEHPQSTQVIFVERGYTSEAVSRKKDKETGRTTVTKSERFNLVNDLIEKLEQQGIPREQIAVVDGSTSKEKRKEIADKMNRAEVRVVIGNTKTLGVGVNMQENLRAMHHLDAPWTPGELEQRNGRGHRQGNKWNTVLEYRYLTERIDGRRWQVLAIKDRFIKAFMKADGSLRVIEGDAVSQDEEGSLDATLSEAAGEPRLLLMNKLRADVEKLQNKERLHTVGVAEAKRKARTLAEEVERLVPIAAEMRRHDAEFREAVKGDFSVTIGAKVYTDPAEATEALQAFVLDNAMQIKDAKNGVKIGSAWGFNLYAAKTWGSVKISARKGGREYDMGGNSVDSLRATLYAIKRNAENVEASIADMRASIPRMQEAAEAPFARQADLTKKQKLLADIEADIQANPVPAPAWLRNGAPLDTIVYINGEPMVVEGHRASGDSFTLIVSAEGKPAREVDHRKAKDASGIPLFEGSVEPVAGRDRTTPAVDSRGRPVRMDPAVDFRLTNGQAGFSKARAQMAVNIITRNWKNAPKIIVLASMEDPATPQIARDAYARQSANGAKGEPKGFIMPDGTVYVVASTNGDMKSVVQTVFHEVLGHYGLRGAFGPELDKVRRQLVAMRRADVLAKAAAYGWVEKDGSVSDVNMRRAAEEVLAELAERNPKLWIVQRAIAAIRSFLRDLGLNLKLTDDEIIRSFIEPARAWVQKGNTAKAVGAEPAFSLGEDQTKTDAFRKWFGNSKVVDENGKPLVMYHGTDRHFDAFNAKAESRHIPLPGFFFTPDSYRAGIFASSSRTGQWESGANIMPVYLSIKNPVEIDASNAANGGRMPSEKVIEQKLKAAREAGHDGAIISGWADGSGPVQYVAFRPNQIKSAIGNNGNFDPASDNIMFSLGNSNNNDDANPRSVMERVQEDVKQFFGGSGEKLTTFGLYDKTLATQYHKALKDEHYNRVFGLVNAMQNHVSLAAVRPAELAPGVLHRVDDVRSAVSTMLKGKKGNAEMQAAANALLAGTLAGDNVLSGKVWTDEELHGMGLNQTAVSYYRQSRAAIDASLHETAAAEAYAMAKTALPLTARREVIDNPKEAVGLIDKVLGRQVRTLTKAAEAARAHGNDEQAGALEASRDQYKALQLRVQQIGNLRDALIKAGYTPLMRFGKYTVTATEIDPTTGQVVKDENGEPRTIYFGKFETEGEAKSVRNQMEARYKDDPSVRVQAGVASQNAHELFSGVSPETLALFAEAVGNEKAMQTYIEEARSERSSLKRRLKRKGTAGFSDDMPRVLSQFITSNARHAAQQYYLQDINSAIKRIPNAKGDVRDEAIRLQKFIMNPADPAAPWSSVMFAWALGGSVASAAVNLTQPVMMTGPYLSQWGVRAAGKSLKDALPMALGRREITDTALADALKRASLEGVVDAQEIFHLYSVGAQGVASGLVNTLAKIPGISDKVKAGSEDARTRINAAMTLLGSMFSAAEGFNRRLTFIAAYNMAAERGEKSPYDFAVRAVNETQGIYNKVNRPNWAQNPVGRTLLMFKQYSIMYNELLSRMWKKGGPAGKRAALMMLGMLMLAAGAGGLPFVDDLDDLIDTIGQFMGYNTNMKRSKREVAYQILGKTLGDLFLYGLSSQLPLDFSGRLGMGNMIPGTSILKPSDENLRGRQVGELLGPTAGLAQQIGDAYDAFTSGNPGKAAQAILLKALRDVAAGIDMAVKGYATDTKGRRTVDTTPVDAAVKTIGFNPTRVAADSRKVGPFYQDIALHKQVESNIVENWANAIINDDAKGVEKAKASRDAWNRKNPESPIVIAPSQIHSRVLQLRTARDQRVVKMAPKEIRGRVAGGLEDVE